MTRTALVLLTAVGLFAAAAPLVKAQPAAAPPAGPTVAEILRRLEATEAELAALRAERAAGTQPVNFQQPPLAGEALNAPTALPFGAGEANQVPEVDPLPNPEFDRQEFDEGPLDLAGLSITGGRFTARPRGRILFDGITFNQTDANIASVATIPGNRGLGQAPDFLGFNQARIGIEGEGFTNIFYEIEVDIAGDGRPDVTDLYIAVTNLPYFGTVFVGNQRVDTSLERVHSLEHSVFMERSLMQALVPGRRPGVKFRNVSADGRATWALGVYRNGDDDYGNTMSTQSNFLVASRLTFLPWYDESSGGRYWWHLGASSAYGQPFDNIARFRTRPEVGGVYAQDEGIRIPFFVSTDDFAARRTYQLGAETALNLGPLNLQSEYMMMNVDRNTADSLFFWGGYVQASLFLTGENRVYRQNRGTYGRVRTYENFFSVQEWLTNKVAWGRGAWQIAARLSHIDLNDGNIQGGRLTDLTLGLNWYLNSRTRVQFNYIRPMLDYQGTKSNADIIGGRFSIFF